jgi:hypothetical protein
MQSKSMVESKRCRRERLKVMAGERRLAFNPMRGQAATDNDGWRTETSCESYNGPNHIVPKG